MLIGALMLILQTVAGFFTMMLLVRTVMRYMRISFVNQIGQFVLATTNWAVAPFQRILPSIVKIDLSSLVPAWLIEVALTILLAILSGRHLGAPAAVLLGACVLGAMELISSGLMLLMGIVIISAILSWVNPYAPVAPMLNQLIRPFLQPFRRLLPPVAGVDLSPLVLILLLQVLQFLLQGFKGNFYTLLYL